MDGEEVAAGQHQELAARHPGAQVGNRKVASMVDDKKSLGTKQA